MYFHSLALQEGCPSPLFLCVIVCVERRLLVIVGAWRVTYPNASPVGNLTL